MFKSALSPTKSVLPRKIPLLRKFQLTNLGRLDKIYVNKGE